MTGTNAVATPLGKPVILVDAVSESSAPGVRGSDVAILERRLAAGDRGGTYVDLYRLTGAYVWLMHAQITTYSGLYGGAALTGNYFAKVANPAKYTVSLDQFSTDITHAMLKLVKQHVRGGGRGDLPLDVLRTLGDRGVWASKGMGRHFPGNALFVDVATHGIRPFIFASPGSAHGVKGTALGAANGKRPSEFARGTQFQGGHSVGGRFATIIDARTRRVEVFFDRKARETVFSQIDDVPLRPSELQWHERLALWEFLQANQDESAKFDARLWNEQKNDAPPNPNIAGLTWDTDTDRMQRQTHRAMPMTAKIGMPAPAARQSKKVVHAKHFRNPKDQRWYMGRPGRPAPANHLPRLETHRKDALAFRRSRGLPLESPLPARYRSMGFGG